MLTVYKYDVPIEDRFTLKLPLAGKFLRCLPPDIDALAQAIQDVCEDHCRAIEEQERGSRAATSERVIYRQPEGEVITLRPGESFSVPIPNK